MLKMQYILYIPLQVIIFRDFILHIKKIQPRGRFLEDHIILNRKQKAQSSVIMKACKEQTGLLTDS